MQGLTEDLKRPPDTLEDLKFVLRVIADIRDKSLEVELRYTDLQERYRTLLMYDIEVRQLGLMECEAVEKWERDTAKEWVRKCLIWDRHALFMSLNPLFSFGCGVMTFIRNYFA